MGKGLVEKLEVVNKKWVRVRLLPGHNVDGSVSFLLNHKISDKHIHSKTALDSMLFLMCFIGYIMV